MGTLFRIVAYAPDEAGFNKASTEAFARIKQLDGIMSDYQQTSELMQLCKKNATTAGEVVKVSPELFTVLAEARKLSAECDGVFDVTVGPLTRLWRLSRRTQMLPKPEELQDALARVGWRKYELLPEQNAVKLLVPGMQLDLGGIAKGYAADEALGVLKKHGITRALVAAGGDVATADPPPDAPHWRVEIQPLTKNSPKRVVLLTNAAVSTSGDLEQFVEINGVRYSHIVDPRTGLGQIGQRSVTVIAPRGILADSRTKALSLLPPEKGLALIENLPGAAGLIVERIDGREVVRQSKGFAAFLAPAE